MVNQSEIIGLPVVVVNDGICIGNVAQITVNANGSGVAGLAIYEKGKSPEETNLFVDIAKVNAIGSFAVTVKDKSYVREAKPEDLRTLSSSGNSTQVLTTMGESAGEVVDFKLDLKTMGFGSILLKKVDDAGKSEYFEANADAVVTYGRDFTIVLPDKLHSIEIDDDAYPVSKDRKAAKSSGSSSSSSSSPSSSSSSSTSSSGSAPYAGGSAPSKPAPAASTPTPPTPAKEEKPVDKRKLEMVKQYSEMLVGKTLAKEVTRPEGGIIALKGTVITEDLINTVYDAAPNMLEILALFAK